MLFDGSIAGELWNCKQVWATGSGGDARVSEGHPYTMGNGSAGCARACCAALQLAPTTVGAVGNDV